jgi:hypothetical protein
MRRIYYKILSGKYFIAAYTFLLQLAWNRLDRPAEAVWKRKGKWKNEVPFG